MLTFDKSTDPNVLAFLANAVVPQWDTALSVLLVREKRMTDLHEVYGL